MATKNFKGFQLVALATFNGAGFTKDKDTLYFVRTNEAKSDGFLYFNNKKYGTAEDAKKALTDKYGDLKIEEKDATIAEYVAAEIAKVNTAAGELGTRVTTLEGKVGSKAVEGGAAATGLFKEIADEASTARAAEKKNADAIAAETTRATAAEEKVKTDLLGGATEDYNTLGKLEGKIKAAQTAADNAQATADAKVKSVEGTNTVIATTTDNAVNVSLKTSDKGNVKFTQDTDGLSANVTIPEATVTGVKADDKFLSLADKLVSADVSIAYDAADKKIYLYGKDKDKAKAVSSIDCRAFIKDGMLDGSALYTATAATGTVTINGNGYELTGLTANHAYIVLVWNTDAEKAAMAIDVTSLIDTYTAKDDGGLKLEDHAFSVDTAKIATVELVKGVTSRVNTLEGKVTTIQGEGEGSIKKAVADEASRAKAAEKKNADAITILNGDSGVTGSVAQKIKTALEAGAVTLEVKNNDAYLGVTSATTAGKGTVYTLASKEAAINKAIKDAADAVKVSVTNGTYVKGSVDEAGRVITLSETVQKVETSSAGAKGLAEASDVKDYVDGKVSSKNVAAEGDTYVSATADANKVTVAATEALKTAVTKANSAVQSVNGKTGSTVTLTGADIATNQNVSGSENATVNAVLADIYSKIGAVKVSSEKNTITVDNTGRIIDVHCQTVPAAQEAGHVALEHGEDGALYGVMYYSGDDVDA